VLRRNAPAFTPGAVGRWQYSNSNYILLGAIIEHAAGVPAHEFLQREIFDVLDWPDELSRRPPASTIAARGYMPPTGVSLRRHNLNHPQLEPRERSSPRSPTSGAG